MHTLRRAALAGAFLTLVLPFGVFADPDSVTKPGTLRQVLPQDTLGYIRVPNPWGFVGAPKGSALDGALKSEQSLEAIEGIREAFAENVLKGSEVLAVPEMTGLFEHARSPLEIAFLLPEGGVSPIPMGLLSVDTDFSSVAELNGFLGSAVAGYPNAAMVREATGSGDGALQLAGLAAFYRFDQETGNFRLLIWPAMNQGVFDNVMARLEPAANHPMTELEASVDSSGHGLFTWLNVEQAQGLMTMTMPPEELLALQESGVLDIRSVGFGWGVSNGRGRFRAAADLPDGKIRSFLWTADNELGVNAAGLPKTVVVLSFPDSTRLKAMVLPALATKTPDPEAAYAKAVDEIVKEMGVDPELILDALGPELVGFSDSVGEYGAFRIRDAAKKDLLIEQFSRIEGAHYETQRIKRRVYHHLFLPGNGLPDEFSSLDDDPDASFFNELVKRFGTHLYWTEEEGYLVVAQVPQMLIDRHSLGANVSIADWLDNTQRHDLESSVLGASTSIANTPRWAYYAYLQILDGLADIADYDLDIFAFPTARDLSLPRLGSYGFKLDVGERFVAAELSFENNPFETLVADSSLAAVAAVGVLAAIAIPAYQDYTIRAQVSEGLSLAAGAKVAVAESYLDRGHAPRNRREAGMSREPSDTQGKYVESVDVANGVVIVTYGNEANQNIAGATLRLTPYVLEDGSLIWRCGNSAEPYGGTLAPTASGEPARYVESTLLPQYLPSACR